jgi:hypothetical protein
MFGNHFYHQSFRKAVAVFGSLFNNINVIRKNSSGAVISQQKVPLSYAPKRDFLERIDNMRNGELGERQIALKLPRMSFEIVAMNYDPSRQLPKMNKCIKIGDDTTKGDTIYTPVPYNVSFQLNVYAKSQDDALQIVEQILPYFTPQYTVTVNPLDEYDVKQDTPITLTGVSFQDDYEGLLEARRSIIYTLDFDMKISLYKDISTGSSIINTTRVDIFDYIDTDLLYSTITDNENVVVGTEGSLVREDAGVITNTAFQITNTVKTVTSFSILRQPDHGTATATLTEATVSATGRKNALGTWTFTPNKDWWGDDSFTISVNYEDGTSIPVVVNVSVLLGEKDAFGGNGGTVIAGQSINVDVTVFDSFESSTVAYTIAAGGYPSNGTLDIISNGVFRYTPNVNFTGVDTFVYRGTPSGGVSETGTVSITVATSGPSDATVLVTENSINILGTEDGNQLEIED